VPRHADDVKGQAASGSNREGESTEAGRRGGTARSSVEGPVMGLVRRGCVVRPWPLANRKREEPVGEAKPFKQRPNIGSRVTREGHARFWERPEAKFLRATRQTEKDRPRRNTAGSPSTTEVPTDVPTQPFSANWRHLTTSPNRRSRPLAIIEPGATAHAQQQKSRGRLCSTRSVDERS